MPERKTPLISRELRDDPLEILANGFCVSLEQLHIPGRSVMTIAMALTGEDKDALLSSDVPGHFTLSDVGQTLNLMSGNDYDLGICQGCTLGLVIDTGVSLFDRSGLRVKARIKPRGDGSCGDATVYIH
jgi:hypothetical protein